MSENQASQSIAMDLNVRHLFRSARQALSFGGGSLMTRFSRSCAYSIFAALMLACLAGAPPAAAETVLRIANLAEPASLDPHKTQLSEGNITPNLFEGLVVLDPRGNIALASQNPGR